MKQARATKNVPLLLLILIMLTLCMIATKTSAASEILVWIEPPTQIVDAEEIFNITLHIDNIAADPGVAGVEFKLTWNPTILAAVNMTEVLFHSTMPNATEIADNLWKIKHTIDNTAGYAWYAYTYEDQYRAVENGYAPISGNHTLAIITFNGTMTGYTELKFTTLKIGDLDANPLPCKGTKGDVTVGNPAPTITIISPRNTTYNTTPINLTFTLSEPASWIGYSMDESTNVTITGNSAISPADGWHNLIVYANDTTGQMSSSDKVYFTVDKTPPEVSFIYSPEKPEAELILGAYRWKVSFDASASFDSVTKIEYYIWDFDDGNNKTVTTPTVTHEYRKSGTYNVTLKVMDTVGYSATYTKTVTIPESPAPPLEMSPEIIAAIVIPVAWIIALGIYLIKKKPL